MYNAFSWLQNLGDLEEQIDEADGGFKVITWG